MTTLQQRTPAWHNARSGKLTASNLAGVLGLSTFCSRNETYKRIRGVTKFEGNDATRYGCANEQNGINAYQVVTGNLVEPTGLWTHKDYNWLAGSPDGLVGDEGMIEVKCPYYRKVAHTQIPIYYYIQMIACLEMTQRAWCDYVCWTPECTTMFRVSRDEVLFDFLLPYWGHVYSCLAAGAEDLPALKADVKDGIMKRVQSSMTESIHYNYYAKADGEESPPCLSEHDIDSELEADEPIAKRMCLSSEAM